MGIRVQVSLTIKQLPLGRRSYWGSKLNFFTLTDESLHWGASYVWFINNLHPKKFPILSKPHKVEKEMNEEKGNFIERLPTYQYKNRFKLKLKCYSGSTLKPHHLQTLYGQIFVIW